MRPLSFILILIVVLSCSNTEPLEFAKKEIDKNLASEKLRDSTQMYEFFKGIETIHFNAKGRKDSLIIEYNKYGLPLRVMEFHVDDKYLEGKLFSKRLYYYDVAESSEIIKHINPQGHLQLTETRKFDSLGRLIFHKENIMGYEVQETYYKYDDEGRQKVIKHIIE